MRRADQIAGLGLLVFGVWYSAVALGYPYWGPGGPGAGFLPAWLGGAMATLAALLLARATRAPEAVPRWLPSGEGLRRLLAVLGATIAFVAALKVTGMILGTALFLVVVLRLVERLPWAGAITVAIATPALNFLIFTYWLRVPFPTGLLGF